MTQKSQYYDSIHSFRQPENPAFNVDARFFLETIDDEQMISILFARHYSGKYFVFIFRYNTPEVQEIPYVFSESSSIFEMSNAMMDVLEKENLDISNLKFGIDEKKYRLSRKNVWFLRKTNNITPLDKTEYMNDDILEPTVGTFIRNRA
jgi:hypothetical protein